MTRYLLKDPQQSISEIIDAAGATHVSESFEPFGSRRDATDWDGDCDCTDLGKMKEVTRRGYTEHEMIGGVSTSLIHMNGRVFDSVIGRFLSADPLVPAPLFSQSFNRYSYVLDNPMSLTDPSGFIHAEKSGKRTAAARTGSGHTLDAMKMSLRGTTSLAMTMAMTMELTLHSVAAVPALASLCRRGIRTKRWSFTTRVRAGC